MNPCRNRVHYATCQNWELTSLVTNSVCVATPVSGRDADTDIIITTFLQTVQMSDDIGHLVRFEVLTAVTMKNGVFWDVMPCGVCKNRRFGGT
jgi:hypothetical protein